MLFLVYHIHISSIILIYIVYTIGVAVPTVGEFWTWLHSLSIFYSKLSLLMHGAATILKVETETFKKEEEAPLAVSTAFISEPSKHGCKCMHPRGSPLYEFSQLRLPHSVA